MFIDESFVDRKTLIRSILALILVMIVQSVTRGPGFIVVVPFAIYALGNRNKPDKLFFYLLLTIAMVVGNAKLMPKDIVFSIVQRSLMLVLAFAMTIQIAGMKTCKTVRPILWFLVYIAYMIIPSADGWCPVISFLKMLLFSSVFLAFYGATARVYSAPNVRAKTIRSVVLSFVMFFMVGSFILIPFPGVSQMSPSEFTDGVMASEATSLFKGMTMHSQCMGPCAAICGVFILSDWMYSIKHKSKLYFFLSVLIPILIYFTSSRTALGSYIAGSAFSLFFMLRARGVNSKWRGKVVSTALMLLVFASAFVLSVPSLQKSVVKFVVKGRGDVINFENVTYSRQGVSDFSMENFRKKPTIGNGFQVAEYLASIDRSSIKNLLTAPIEKGFWGSAVLEEGGVCGMVIFILCLIFILTGLIRHRAYVGASCFFTLFMANFGEFMMFSMSYTGGFLWAMVFGGLGIDVIRNREERLEQRMMFDPMNRRMW